MSIEGDECATVIVGKGVDLRNSAFDDNPLPLLGGIREFTGNDHFWVGSCPSVATA